MAYPYNNWAIKHDELGFYDGTLHGKPWFGADQYDAHGYRTRKDAQAVIDGDPEGFKNARPVNLKKL
jgi:hypothetical protein